MKAVVIGGGGFLGSRIVEMLLARGDQVRVLGRSRYPRLEKIGATCVVGDIRESAVVNQALRGAEIVFHTAAKTGVWGRPEDFFAVNSRGTANVIQGCLVNQVEKLVYTSSPSVVFQGNDIIDGGEDLPYANHFLAAYPASKSMAERMVLDAHGWEFVIAENNPESDEIMERHGSRVRQLATCALRPHLIWGPGDPHLVPRLLEKALAGRLKCVGDGSNEVSLTYIDNAASAHLAVADRLTVDSAVGGQVYFINDRDPVRLWEWINDLLQAIGLPPVSKKIPFRLAALIGAWMELVYRLAGRRHEPPMTRFVAEQLARSHSFSWMKARRDFSYEPIVDNTTGMRELIMSLKAELAVDRLNLTQNGKP